MKLFKKTGFISLILAVFVVSPIVYAATSPSLGMAGTFGILSSTYTNTLAGTTINGDLGYTTPPTLAPTVTGTTHAADSTYSQAGADQGTALASLNAQACTFTFATGPIDLASDTTHGPVGVYTPGVYCANGATSVGGGGTVTLKGSGTFIFRTAGALTTTANSIVTLVDGASACNVWWTPAAATTLGVNSTFIGTDIDDSGITVGNLVSWAGRALAFGGTVSTHINTITVPTCAAAPGNTTTAATAAITPGATAGLGGTPGLPNTGGGPQENNIAWWSIPTVILAVSSTIYLIRKNVNFFRSAD